MTETERVLQVLIHDARTPIGVALGYLRLLQERRLATDEERDKAIARTLDAIGRLSRLCDQASGFVGARDKRDTVAVSAADLAARVEDVLKQRQFAVDGAPIDPLARVRITVSPDRLADAVSDVLGSVPPNAPDAHPTLRVEATASELRFTATTDQHPAATDGPRAFDPWRAVGLALPLACHVIEQSDGRIESADPALTVAFPLDSGGAGA